MPLLPEDNKQYWPLLLTDDLYLLPQDLQQQSVVVNAPPAVKESAVQATTEAGQEAAKKLEVNTTAAATVPKEAVSASPAAPQPDLIWGSIQRGVLILVEYPEHPLMDRPDGLFLVEVLKAVGFDFKEVAILNISRCQSAADWEYVRQLPWQQLISFGVRHQELDFTQEGGLFELSKWGDRSIVQAEKLSIIRNDTASKKKLWNLLKQVFV